MTEAGRARQWGPALLAVAVALVLLGLFRGEAAWVLRYARTLCLSCMGLGH
jgi:hypothetical protein